jgi:hypothetical protein
MEIRVFGDPRVAVVKTVVGKIQLVVHRLGVWWVDAVNLIHNLKPKAEYRADAKRNGAGRSNPR